MLGKKGNFKNIVLKKILLLSVFLFYLLTIQTTFAQINFNLTTQVSTPRQMYGTVVLGDYLYLIGGNREISGFCNSVEFANIFPDGNIGNWRETSPLPYPVSYIENSTIALNDIVYVVCGYNGLAKKSLNTILWAKPDVSGNLSSWTESVPYNGKGVYCCPSIATPGYLHIIGGLSDDDSISNKVWSAKISLDGSIISWEEGPALPTTLWYASAGVAGGKVWIWGGLKSQDRNIVNNSVYYAPILSDGKIGSWQVSNTTLQKPFYSAYSTISGSYLLSFCPRYSGSVPSADVWYASITADGLSQWVQQTSNVKATLYIGIATDYRRGNIYIPGGRTNKDNFIFDKNVYYIKLAGSQKADERTDMAVTIDQNVQRIEASRLSYINQQQAPTQSTQGFVPYNQVRELLAVQSKPLVLYFYSNKAKRCIEQSQILASFNTAQYGGKVIFAEAETTQLPQLSQQYGIFKVPAWLFFDTFGNVVSNITGVIQASELDSFVRKISQ